MTALRARGYRFDGVNDYVEAPPGQLVGGVAPLTLEAWAYVEGDDPGGGGTRAVAGQWSGNLGFAMTVDPTGRTLVVNTNGNTRTMPLPASWTPNGWRHLAVTKTGTVVEGYCDAAILTSPSAVAADAGISGVPFAIGSRGAGDRPFRGHLRDVRVWDRVLAPGEMAPFRPSLRGDEPGLLGWWPLEADTLERARRALGPDDGDTFEGETMNLVAHTTRRGKTWTPEAGTWVVDGGTVKQVAASGGIRRATFDAGFVDHRVRVRCRSFTNYVGVVGRYVDASNHLYVRRQGGLLILSQVVGGVASDISANVLVSADSASWADVGLEVVDSVAVVSYDGVEKIRVVLAMATAAALRGGTKVGLYNQATQDAEYEWIAVEPVAGGSNNAAHGAPRGGARLANPRAVA